MGKVCVPVMKFLENVQGSRCKKGMYNECNGYQWEEMARQLKTHFAQKLGRILSAFVFYPVQQLTVS